MAARQLKIDKLKKRYRYKKQQYKNQKITLVQLEDFESEYKLSIKVYENT